MFMQIYECKKCQQPVTFMSSKANDPLSGKFVFHSDVMNEQYNELIEGEVVFADAGCDGLIVYCGTAAQDGVVFCRPNRDKLRKKVTWGWRAQQLRQLQQPEKTAADVSDEFMKQSPYNAANGVNTICAAIDSSNPGRKAKGTNMHALTRNTINQHLGTILAPVQKHEAYAVTTCAEIQAVHKVLNAGALLGNIRVHTRVLSGGRDCGSNKPPCNNCNQWLEWAATTPRGEHIYKIKGA
jgi:hypothetical protein